MNEIVLKKNEDRRVRRGHLWIFSNEIEKVSGSPDPGSWVRVRSHRGHTLGVGFFHPNSLIAVRIISNREFKNFKSLVRRRVRRALELRERIYPGGFYRLVHGESDGLPGLVVDRYGTVLVVRISALGMDMRSDSIVEILLEETGAGCVVERNEFPARSFEGLPLKAGIVKGDLPGSLLLEECGVQMSLDVLDGHKTGSYYDQRENRSLFARYTRSGCALDLFCNDGAFALRAAAGGDAEVRGVELSEKAQARASANASLNGLEEKVRFQAGAALERIEIFRAGGHHFDAVNLDPPAFAPGRKKVPQARKAYMEVNAAALSIVRSGGFFASSCCSAHITEETFLRILRDASSRAGVSLQFLHRGEQAPDHPVLPAMPETRYLKFFLARVFR